ncbi:MAG: PAS domain S-box protein [Desulfohalobiaceae bacterium]|nr:PAS domain S-box protein [Desulfohalobiaceae bacterium]
MRPRKPDQEELEAELRELRRINRDLEDRLYKVSQASKDRPHPAKAPPFADFNQTLEQYFQFRQFERFFEAAGLGIFHSSMEGSIIRVNPSLAAMFGYGSPGELLDDVGNSARIMYADPKQRTEFLEQLRQVKGSFKMEMAFRRRDQSVFPGIITAWSVRDKKGSPGYLEGFIEDITKQKALEESLRQSEKLEAIGTLTSGIAHDFNNILAAVGNLALLVLEELPPGGQAARDLEQIVRSTDQGKDLIASILSFSRKDEIQQEPLVFSTVIKEVAKLLQASLPSSVALDLEIRDPSGLVEAKPGDIQKVIINLCTNARDALEPDGGRIRIMVDNTKIRAKGGQTQLALEPGQYIHLRSAQGTGAG